jgi:hypothetical protein
MRIVKRRDKHIGLTRQWDCKNCGSTIESEVSDGTVKHEIITPPSVQTECPHCGTYNWLVLAFFKDATASE